MTEQPEFKSCCLLWRKLVYLGIGDCLVTLGAVGMGLNGDASCILDVSEQGHVVVAC